MRRLLAATLVLAFVGVAALAQAEDKADPTGTWKWSVTFNQQTRDMTLKLKLEGDKLTGTLTGPGGRENPIQDGTFKDGQVSFKVVRDAKGRR